MAISKDLAVAILKYLHKHNDFYFPFKIMAKEPNDLEEGFIELESSMWKEVEKYAVFELWENLQDLHEETTRLLAKGFIEKITAISLESHIEKLAQSYRKEWKEELWESEKIEEYGLNEFLGGKAEAYEDCLFFIRKYQTGFETN